MGGNLKMAEQLKEKNLDAVEFSNYGEYTIVEKLDLTFPKTKILIDRKSENQFSYYRKNSEGEITNKIIPRMGKDLLIEVAPLLPLNLPAKKTNDLIFLRLAQHVFVEKNSNIEFLIQFPIEIGVFVINQDDGSKDFLDCFTVEPMHSRFALYGIPENGFLCMYSKVSILERTESDPYIFAIMKVSIKNELKEGVSLGKLVFPVTHHEIYYANESSEVHIDDIQVELKKEIKQKIALVSHVDYSKKTDNWKLAPRAEPKHEKKVFVMDRGFD